MKKGIYKWPECKGKGKIIIKDFIVDGEFKTPFIYN